MIALDVLDQRLHNQGLVYSAFKSPQEVVAWMGAIQAQEYAVSKWAVGMRLPGSDDAQIEAAMNSGEIIRTHVLRPTWHFVAPADLRWMLKLTAPRIHAINAPYARKFEVDAAMLSKAHGIILKQLEGGNYLSRNQLNLFLQDAGIKLPTIPLSLIFMHAELEGMICSGPRVGKQFTYALIDERVAAVPEISREEALVRLCERFFASRGPATVKDFSYWSGLTQKDGKDGVANLRGEFVKEVQDGEERIFVPSRFDGLGLEERTFLLPDYDEYGMSYSDRQTLSHPDNEIPKGAAFPFFRMIILDGRIAGAWQRTVKGKVTHVETAFFRKLSAREEKAVGKAVERFLDFVN